MMRHTWSSWLLIKQTHRTSVSCSISTYSSFISSQCCLSACMLSSDSCTDQWKIRRCYVLAVSVWTFDMRFKPWRTSPWRKSLSRSWSEKYCRISLTDFIIEHLSTVDSKRSYIIWQTSSMFSSESWNWQHSITRTCWWINVIRCFKTDKMGKSHSWLSPALWTSALMFLICSTSIMWTVCTVWLILLNRVSVQNRTRRESHSVSFFSASCCKHNSMKTSLGWSAGAMQSMLKHTTIFLKTLNVVVKLRCHIIWTVMFTTAVHSLSSFVTSVHSRQSLSSWTTEFLGRVQQSRCSMFFNLENWWL